MRTYPLLPTRPFVVCTVLYQLPATIAMVRDPVGRARGEGLRADWLVNPVSGVPFILSTPGCLMLGHYTRRSRLSRISYVPSTMELGALVLRKYEAAVALP